MDKLFRLFRKTPTPRRPSSRPVPPPVSRHSGYSGYSDSTLSRAMPLDSQDWERLRSPRTAHDECLSTAAQVWLGNLPARLQPMQLCERYPRVANRLALCWRDPGLTEQLFNEFLLDRRGGRKGFPPPVAIELLRLREWHDQRPIAEVRGDDRWDSRFLAVVDR